MNKTNIYKIYLAVFYAFCFSLLLIKFPPFNISQFVSKLSTTHVLAKFMLLFISVTLVIIDGKNVLSRLKQAPFLPLLSVYFLCGSISVFEANDISFFIQQYQNVVFGIIMFILAYLFVIKIDTKKIITFIIIVGLLSLLSDVLFILFSSSLLILLEEYIQKEMYALYSFNLNENKYNLYLSTEIFLPFFLFYIATYWKKRWYIFSIISTVLMGFIALFSNFRTRLIQFVFVSMTSIYYLRSTFKKSIIPLLVLILIGASLSFMVIRSNTSFDILDRFILSDEKDVNTILYRFDTFSYASSILQAKPLFGVGLGNYKFYINQRKNAGIRDEASRLHTNETNDNPHSVFIQIITETGVIGFISFIALLFYFLKNDIGLMKNQIDSKNSFLFSCIIASWTLFLYGVFNPFNTIFLNGWFWYFRGTIEGIRILNSKS